jgi:hypothetical protein
MTQLGGYGHEMTLPALLCPVVHQSITTARRARAIKLCKLFAPKIGRQARQHNLSS